MVRMKIKENRSAVWPRAILGIYYVVDLAAHDVSMKMIGYFI
jgi:hypothetical protein